MNAATRKQISKIVSSLEELKSQLENLKSEIEEIQSEEQDKFDNMPEGLQQGEGGQKIETAANALSEANDEFDSIESSLDSILANLETASE